MRTPARRPESPAAFAGPVRISFRERTWLPPLPSPCALARQPFRPHHVKRAQATRLGLTAAATIAAFRGVERLARAQGRHDEPAAIRRFALPDAGRRSMDTQTCARIERKAAKSFPADRVFQRTASRGKRAAARRT